MATVSIANAAHVVRGRPCDGWHLPEGDDPGVIEERMPPGAAHPMRNDAGAELRFLAASSPHSHGDREAVDG
ncbi:hypothetical protein ACO2Q2_10465 [Dyella sp. KRB-257]|uniref:hypothetical protein n=1 Tax=Dyella sp. KRB-257 TaxID=3400915 RepID=UPI003C08542E